MVGRATLAEWAAVFADGAAVLDFVLAARGRIVYGVDAAATMIADFRGRFCSTV